MEGMSERTSLLVGDEGIERLRNASAIVVGNGAVGGYALEGLVRAGIGRIRTVDGDVFSASNMNRQILATTDTVGRPKAEVACERARSVNPDIDIEPLMLHVDEDTIPAILDGDFDILIDAIDTVRCKVMLLRAASEKGIRTFSSMGAARHMKVDTVRIGRLSETSVCPVAAAVRKGMRGFDVSMITCVYNIEPPIACDGGRDDHGKSVLGSMPTVPAVMGMTLANEAISFLLGRRRRRNPQWFPAKTLNETSPKTSMQHQEIGRRRYVLMEYIPRLADKELAADLKIFGAVVISGPRWTGKTATAARVAGSVLMMQDPDSGSASLMTAELKPSRLLEGKTPRFIDEWQEAPQLWDAVRLTVDDRDEPGQFILTGSAAADRRRIRHSGAGRFCEIRMGTMTLFESGDSSGTVSLKGLFDGGVADAVCDRSLEEMAHLVVRGGWPEAAGRDTGAAIRIIDGYCDILTCPDATGSPSERHDGSRFAAVMHSLSRSVSAPLSKTGIIADVSSKRSISISENTLNAYLDDLGRTYILDNLHAWHPILRSRTPIRVADTIHFCDPSIAARLLSLSPDDLLDDPRTFSSLFESLVVRDLRVYARTLDGEVFHYRDKNGLEADAIIRLNDGRWAAIEVKLGDAWVDEAARNLKKLAENVDTDRMGRPAFLAVVTATRYAYTRPDGVHVIPLAVLGP